VSSLIVEVVEILDIEDHPNADRLEIATVKGWNVICGLGEYKPGDKAIYIPVDSVLPAELEEKIFANSKVKLNKHRVRAVRIRKVISQGLLIPLTVANIDPCTRIGIDVAADLGITKYEPPERGQGLTRGPKRKKKLSNPNFFKYTKIERIENYPTALTGCKVVVTEKVHGTSFRGGILPWYPKNWFDRIKGKVLSYFGAPIKYEPVYGSRNVELQYKSTGKRKDGFYKGSDVYYDTYERYNMSKVVEPGVVIYGEIYGPGIQKNYSYGLKEGERGFVVFDVMRDGRYLDVLEAKQYCEVKGMSFVPVLFIGRADDPEIDKLVGGPSVLCPTQKIREGIVIRTAKESANVYGRTIYKRINPEYLLKDNSDWH